MRKLEQEVFEQRKQHIKDEYEMLRKLLVEAQKQQMCALKTKFEAENKELKLAQTKKSMEDIKTLQQACFYQNIIDIIEYFKDKSIKSKAERDRRIKELNEKNVKMFVEERKRLATKYLWLKIRFVIQNALFTRCRRHEEQLEKKQSEQCEALDKDIIKVTYLYSIKITR